ncbi:unnamed protein product [Arabis nemorensis]|uniref:RPM1 interacting protein 13 n=1 Tax=Arabis nemorensis TaxID=586526 RepID=A0A565BE10_9BRAS|nr:unnamed protein product [Arabis nemorensis]
MDSGNHEVVDLSSDDEVDTKVDRDYFDWLNEVMEAVEEKSESTDVVEIACRDFPHPRHSCAKYAFNTTSHDKYCDMCHCYVCDIPAPCPYWCIGISSVNHCHANDKEKIWKNQREYFRTGNMPTTPPSSKPTMPLPASVTVTHQFSRSTTQSIVRLSQNSLTRNQVGIRPCSSSGRVANHSNVRARSSRVKQSISLSHNHGLQNRQVQSLSSVRNNVIQKDRSSYMGNLRPRVASSGARHGATHGNNIKVGLYANAQVSQSTHHSSSIVAPMINPAMFTQQQPNVTDHCSAVTGSQSNVYTRHSGHNKSSSGNRQFQANAGLLTPSETPLTSANSQAHTVQQQPGTNENVLQTKLVEFESWLMDSSNHIGPVCPLPEPVSQDYVSSMTFDFETFLND